MPVDENKLAVSQWDHVEEKFAKKIVGWKENLTLVNACLASICLYMLSFLEAPKGFINKADIHRKRMLGKRLMTRKGITWSTGTLSVSPKIVED
jgi:hypothetical protein